MFAIVSLRQLAEISKKVTRDNAFADECNALADEVEAAIKEYAIVEHPKFGKVYAFEVDGFGNTYFMDDANVPSLLAMPYLNSVDINDPIYRNTRKLVLSKNNPYFFKGKAAEGIGGPHIGYDMIWPMSIIMRAETATDDDEIGYCLRMLRDTDADTGFMHESFHKDDPTKFTRSWFAWANTLFGELIVKLEKEGKIDLLNSL
jgi:meiotically up-regulated gene 157 (Mug157) protein